MIRSDRPAQTLYLLVESGLLLGLSYFTFIGGAFAGIYLFGPRPLSQAIVGVVAIGWLASKFLYQRPWPITPIDRPLVVALGAVAIAALFSVDRRLSLDSGLVIFTYALAFWFLYEQIQAPWFADLLLKCLLIVGGIVCLIASSELLRWYFGFPDGPSWPSLGLGIWPPTPPRIGMLSLGSPNHLSGYLALLVPLALTRGVVSHRRIERLSLWFLGLLMLGLIGVSQSRGGLLGALGGLSMLALGVWPRLGARWPRLRPTRRRIAALALWSITSFFGLTVMLTLRSRVHTARVRLDMWAAALQMVAHRPIFGIGPGSFGLEYLRYRDATQFSEVFSQAHNIYLHTLATLGITGTLASGWFVYTLLAASWRLWRAEADPGWQWMRLGAIAGLVAFATHGLFDAFFLEFPAVFQIVIVLTALALRPVTPHPTSPRIGRWWLKPTIASALIALGLGFAVWSDAGFAAFDRAITASHQGDWAATVEALKTAIHRDPAYDYYKLQLGLAYGQLAADDPAYLPESIAAYRSAGIERDHYALNHANLAWLLWEAGERDAALHEMIRAVELEAISPNYHLNLGLMLEETGQFESARLEYAQAVVRNPALLQLSFWDQGQSAARRREQLAEIALTLSQTPQRSSPSLTPGKAAYYLGDWDTAMRWLQTSLDSSPNDPDRKIDMGKVWLATGKPDQALDAAQQALEAGAPTSEVFALQAEAHLALGNLDAAAADLQALRFLSPGSSTYLLLGQLAEIQGEFEKATTYYQTAINTISSIKAVNYGPWVWKRPPLLADTLPYLQQPALAESLIEAYLALGNLYARRGMVSEAREAYRAILSINPDQAEAQKGLEALP
jgi:tetratricopeptide (TPR) repeat protein/O-antigen ligase